MGIEDRAASIAIRHGVEIADANCSSLVAELEMCLSV